MKYKEFGLVNTRNMFADAIARGYAVGAFNFYNMETMQAILSAAHDTHSPVILAVSESALKYMGPDTLMGMIAGQKLSPERGVALHLDHGASVAACRAAIDMGFSSVMIDASGLPIEQNMELARQVVAYAHPRGVSVEAELGQLSGIEDENTHSEKSSYTDPRDVIRFVKQTGIDSLAIAIGTSHGAYKRKSENEELRFDILNEIAATLPEFPLVLHGASVVPQQFVQTINECGGELSGARGIPAAQLRRAVGMNICKINIDSDSRLAFTASVRMSLMQNPTNFNPREFLGAGRSAIHANCMAEIRDIMGSENKL